MSGWKKLAAASAGGDDPLNVENVFSTFLYQGISSGLAINNGIALGDGPDGTTGTSTRFDGTNDSLNKSSDLSGNSDGKTFTFSFWVNPTQDTNTDKRIYHTSGSWRNEIRYGNDGGLFVVFFNNESSGGTVFEIQSPNIKLAMGGWNHVLISADLTDTSKRHLYINDNLATPGWSYTNNTIDWTRSTHAIGDDLTATTGNFQGDLAHFFLDYTYRDFSVESNRRIFIDSAFGSTSVSTLSALNPIIYLPMTTGYSVGENEGTGGNFSAVGSPSIVSNGTQAEAGVGQGGMVWVKNRSGADNHLLTSNPPNFISPNQNVTQYTNNYNFITKFTSNGFLLGGGVWGSNSVSNTSVAWTWRKAPKFFDVVTFSGTGSSSTNISHSLGVEPGMIIIKRTNSTSDWGVWHRGNGTSDYTGLSLNANTASAQINPNSYQYFTSSYFKPTYVYDDSNSSMNVNGGSYVAYLFAHNDGDGEFGPTGDQDIIKCGKYTGNGGAQEINLGFEAQWVLLKRADGLNDSTFDFWHLTDIMRGMPVQDGASNAPVLIPNATDAESTGYSNIRPTANGFAFSQANTGENLSGKNYIYMAIRRGPMATPESASDVFAIDTYGGTSPNPPIFNSGFPVDMFYYKELTSGGGNYVADRLRDVKLLRLDTTAAETTSDPTFDYMDGVIDGTVQVSSIYGWMWRRAPGYFDMVAYDGNSTGGRTVNHNLGVVPEMMWVFRRNATANNYVYHAGINSGATNTTLGLDTSLSVSGFGNFDFMNGTQPTSSVFSLSNTAANINGKNYIAYLFATVAGVSKVGSYTGDGTTGRVIDCGFSNGAKYVLLKDTTSSGDWYTFDSVRGIVSGNEPFNLLNVNSPQNGNLDSIDPNNSGFIINQIGTNLNVNNSKYIFYAIAA